MKQSQAEQLTSSSLPPIGFGTGQLQGQVAEIAVEAALQTGYRLIDTGANYGNETEMGQAVVQSGIARQDIIIMTKGAHNEDEHGYQQTLDAFQASLGRLSLEYIDYYLIHWPENPAQRQETWRAMIDIQHSGQARAIGVSNYAEHHLEELESSGVTPSVNQIEFHPYIFSEQKGILDYCLSRGIQVVGYATHANGQADNDPVVQSISEHHRKSVRQVLTRWSMQHNIVPLVRSSKLEHIAENYKVDDFVLSANDMQLLDNLRGVRQFRNPADLP